MAAENRYFHDQDGLNTLFEDYNVSFRDINHFVSTMENLIWDYIDGRDAAPNVAGWEAQVELSLCQPLFGVLSVISMLQDHRHRDDANNILTELENRTFRGHAPVELVSIPLEPDYRGPGRQEPPVTADEIYANFRPEIEDSAARLRWWTGMPLPEARRVSRMVGLRVRDVPPDNAEAIALLSVNATTNHHANLAMNNLMAGGEHVQFQDPAVFRDDPAEICLQLPEDCAFLTAQTPVSTRFVTLMQAHRPPVEVWDHRLGSLRHRRTTLLGTEHYIHVLVDNVRNVVATPEVARAYAIIFRGDPLRYAMNSTDEIVDELPPTVDEIASVLSFMTQSFPEIRIIRNDMGPDIMGYHDRLHLNRIDLNGLLFDEIELRLRQGGDVGHLLYMVYVTIIHELSHWFYSCIYLQGTVISGALHTPRKLRLFIRATGDLEDQYHPDFIQTNPLWGEMGQIIEWLIFGFMVEWHGESEPDILKVYCWGSHPLQGPDQLRISSAAAQVLLSRDPPERMQVDALRAFLNGIPAGRGPRLLLENLHFRDVDEDYSMRNIDDNQHRRYRKAIHRINSERQRTSDGLAQLIGAIHPRRRRVYGPVVAAPPGPSGASSRYISFDYIVILAGTCVALYLGLTCDPGDPGCEREKNSAVEKAKASWGVILLLIASCLLLPYHFYQFLIRRKSRGFYRWIRPLPIVVVA